MMKRKCILLIISCLILTGCWDGRELNELAIAIALGIDEADGEYLITAQTVVPSQVASKGSTGSSPVTLFQEKGETIDEAIRKLANIAPREIYPGHLRVLVISESVAKKGIGKLLDFFSRNWEVRTDFFVVIAKDTTAEDVLNVTTAIESIPANKIYNTLNVSDENLSATRAVTMIEILNDLSSNGKEAVVTGIEVFGDLDVGSSIQNVQSIKPKARIDLDGLAVFKNDKLVGWLTEDESRGYNKVTNRVKRSVTTLSCPQGGFFAVELIRDKSKVKAKVKNGQPQVEVTVHVDADIGEVDCPLDLTKTETILQLEQVYSEKIKEIIQTSISALQEDFDSDIFGFGEAIHRADPKAWKKLEKNWDQEFAELPVNINVEVKIRRTGTISNALKIGEED